MRPLRLVGSVAALALLGLGVGPSPDRDRPDSKPPSACCSHACNVTTYQGCGCGSVACFPRGYRLAEGLVTDHAARAALAALKDRAPCVNGLAAGMFPCLGVDLESYVPFETLRAGATAASNMWGFRDLDDGREYAVIGVSNGTSVVDVTEPASPRVVGSVEGPESPWREAKVHQRWNALERRWDAYAYVVSEAPTAGLQILDLTGLPASATLAATFRAFDTAHTVTLANADPATGAPLSDGTEPVLYVQGARNPVDGVYALDISDPTAPVVLGRYDLTYGHDIWTGRVAREAAQACGPGRNPCDLVVVWTGQDIRVLDWTDKAAPRVVATVVYPDLGYAHSGWVSRDGRHLFSMDELDERITGRASRVRVFDVADWANPILVSEWTGTTTAIEHNGYVHGDRYYVSHYERGLTILDVTDPRTPVEEAFFDTFPASDASEYHGSWGVYPYLPSGTILLSNIDGAGGLFVVRRTPSPGATEEVPRAPIVRVSPSGVSPRAR